MDLHDGRGHLSGWAPTTILGRSAVAFAGVFLFGLVVMAAVVASGQRGGNTLFDNWWISGPALLAAISAVASFVTGVLAVLCSRERSALVKTTVVVQGLVTVFLIGELAVAH